MRAASAPRSRAASRILVVDASSGAMRVVPQRGLATLFSPGDLLVVNDAATVPASLVGTTAQGEVVEVRLMGALDDRRWRAALFGGGD